MARKYYELGGKLYEAVTACGLEDLGFEYVLNPPLLLMHVVPDFVIPEEKNPKIVILVTHSTAQAGTKMKFLRNIDELFEIKSRIYPKCKAINLIYSSKRGWKPQLLHILRKVFDGNLVIFNQEYGQEFLDRLHKNALTQIEGLIFEETKERVRNIIESNKRLREIYHKYFLTDLKEVLSSPLNQELVELWKREYGRVQSLDKRKWKIKMKNTYFKRGLIKASFLNKSEIELLHGNVSQGGSRTFKLDGVPKNVEQHLLELGLIEIFQTLTGREASLDQELCYILSRMNVKEIISFIEIVRKEYPDVDNFLFKMRDTTKLREMISIICNGLQRDDKPYEDTIFQMLKECHEQDDYLGFQTTRNWVFETCMDIIRHFVPKHRYSFDVLCEEANLQRGQGLARFSYVDFFERKARNLPDEKLQKISKVFANHFKSLRVENIKNSMEKIVSTTCHFIFITLAKHRTINFLKPYVRQILERHDFEIMEEGVRIRSNLSEYAGAKVGAADSTYTFSVSKKGQIMIVDVIAAYAGTHKHKEMSARIRMSKYVWDKRKRSFEELKQIRRWILVLDGPWKKLSGGKTKFFEMLYESGWDFVTYPDELPNILKLFD